MNEAARGFSAGAVAVLVVATLLILWTRPPPQDPVDSFLASLPEIEVGEPLLTLGGERWSQNQLYWSIDFAALTASGQALVFDAMDRRIHSYTRDGRHLASWGESGRGPGEFVNLMGGLGPEDEILAWDPGQRRLTRFGPRGTLIDDQVMVRRARWNRDAGPGRDLGNCHGFAPNLDREQVALVQCLAGLESPTAEVPGGRWVRWEDGSYSTASPRGPGPDPLVDAGVRFIWTEGEPLPWLQGNWADPSSTRWTVARGHVVVFDESGFVRGVIRAPGVLVTLHDGVGAFLRTNAATGAQEVTFRRIRGTGERPEE